MILAIDWDARHVRVVHAGVKKGSVTIERMLAAEIPADVDSSSPQAMGILLRQILSQQKIRTDRVILDVPRDQALLTTLKLPAATMEEMPALVEFQIAKEIPFSLSEAVVDFAMPQQEQAEGTVDVLVGTVRKDVVDYYRATCEAAKLKLERLGLRPYANKVAINDLLGTGRHDCAVMIEVGPRMTEIDVIAHGQLAFSRAASVSVPRPVAPGAEELGPDSSIVVPDEESGSSILQFPAGAGPDGTDPQRVVNAVLVEVTRSIEAYRASAGGINVGMIVVAGGTGVEERLAEAIGRRYSATVELYNPARQFRWPEDRGVEARAFSAAIGLVSGHAAETRLQFDFLHPKKPVTTAARRLRKAPAFAAVAVLFIAAPIIYYVTTIAPQKMQLARYQEQIEVAEEVIGDLKSVQKEIIREAEAFDEDQIVWIDDLQRIAQVMPDRQKMILGKIDLSNRGARIAMPLKAIDEQAVLDAVSRIDAITLEGSKDPYFDAQANNLSSRESSSRRRRGNTTETQYPTTGSIEVVIRSKVEE